MVNVILYVERLHPFIYSFYFRECLNVGTVPTYKMHNIGTVPMFKMHCFTESSRTPFLGLASPFQSDINCMEEECAVQKAPF